MAAKVCILCGVTLYYNSPIISIDLGYAETHDERFHNDLLYINVVLEHLCHRGCLEDALLDVMNVPGVTNRLDPIFKCAISHEPFKLDDTIVRLRFGKLAGNTVNEQESSFTQTYVLAGNLVGMVPEICLDESLHE